MSPALYAEFMTVACSRKRKNSIAGTSTSLTSLMCTPKAPVDMPTRQSLGLHAPHVVYEVHLEGAPDIKKGDVLVIGSAEFQIHDASPWLMPPPDNVNLLKLVIEDLSNNAV
jgi:hypothetical protein